MPRRFPIFQLPNRPLIIAMAARAAAALARGPSARGAGAVSDAALLVWAAEEVADGANWVRRLIGAGGGVLAIASLQRDLPAIAEQLR